MQEIERKFLVTSQSFLDEAVEKQQIIQGYISLHPSRSVRVRIQDNCGFITIKGASNPTGLSRFEWECSISVVEAKQLLKLIEGTLIQKTRYRVPTKTHCFEVDVFEGEHEGLIIAEIELKEEDESFEKPAWLGKEVSGKPEYYNVSLAKKR